MDRQEWYKTWQQLRANKLDGHSVVVPVIVVAVLDHVDRATFEHLSEFTDSFKGFELRRSPDQKAVSLGGGVASCLVAFDSNICSIQ